MVLLYLSTDIDVKKAQKKPSRLGVGWAEKGCLFVWEKHPRNNLKRRCVQDDHHQCNHAISELSINFFVL